jgi:hypothetical protein
MKVLSSSRKAECGFHNRTVIGPICQFGPQFDNVRVALPPHIAASNAAKNLHSTHEHLHRNGRPRLEEVACAKPVAALFPTLDGCH